MKEWGGGRWEVEGWYNKGRERGIGKNEWKREWVWRWGQEGKAGGGE